MPIRIFCRNRKRGFCNTVQNLAIKLPSAMTSNFPCVNSKKNTFSNGNVCHFKFCYNKINQFCNTVQNLATKLPSAITATLFFFQLLLCVVILVRNIWFLSPLVHSKREKSIQTETTKAQTFCLLVNLLIGSVCISFQGLVRLSSFSF